MDKQTILAFVFITAILFIWLYISAPEPVKEPVKKKDTTTVVVDSAKIKEQKAREENKRIADVQTADSLSYGKYFSVSAAKENIIVVENDLVKFELSTKGANFRKYFLKNFNNWQSDGKDQTDINNKVQLLNYSRGDALDLSFVTADGKAINTADLEFMTDNKYSYKVSGNDSITISFTLPVKGGGYIKKNYKLHGDKYDIHTSIELSGLNNLISNNTYDIVWTGGLRFVEENSFDEANFSNASVFYGDEQVIVDAPDAGAVVEQEFNGRVDWMAVRNKYFSAIIAPENPLQVEGAFIKGERKNYPNMGVREFYTARLIIPFKNLTYEKQNLLIYIGPVDYDHLKEYGRSFEAIVDFGSLFGLKFIIRPISEYVLLPLFNFLHTFIPNYGFVIIVFSLIIKIALYPLTKSSFQSMKRMQLLQPKITELKEKYKDDPQKMNKETMALYKVYGINPAGGCLPLLLQMPIFIALWGLFQVSVELRQQPFMLWIHDLSRPDIIAQMPFKIPLFGIDVISGLALLMGITMFIQQKQTVKDPKQQGLVYIMPVMMTLMFMTLPSGLNLYYFMFNLFSIAQQYYINHKHTDMVLEPVKNPKKQKGFMQKLMDAAEKNSKAQQQRRKR